MFTGIITHIGSLENIEKNPNQDLLITIKLEDKNIKSNLDSGCSIACNGICLTLIKKIKQDNHFYLSFEASKETGVKTNINSWQINDKINLEFALRLGDELGGHMVSGHVDGVAKIKEIKEIDKSYKFTLEAPEELTKFICQKGSVTLNGISLTVNDVEEELFSVNIIDHTFNNTNLQFSKEDDEVNLEIDTIARYLEKLNK